MFYEYYKTTHESLFPTLKNTRNEIMGVVL